MVSLAGAWYWKRSASGTPLSTPQKSSHPQNKLGAAKLGATPAHRHGPEEAPVLLEEFADFECGGCAALHPIMKAMQKEFGSRLTVIFREYPLSSHKHSMTAAQAAEAAGLQGKFWEMHDLLFADQKTWHEATDVRPLFREYASTLGLAVERFERDMSSESVNRRIAMDHERGEWIGVNSTPTVFMNGREVPFESFTTEKLRPLIQAEINSSETRKN